MALLALLRGCADEVAESTALRVTPPMFLRRSRRGTSALLQGCAHSVGSQSKAQETWQAWHFGTLEGLRRQDWQSAAGSSGVACVASRDP